MTGIERIQQAFKQGRSAFMPYSVLGYPNRQASLDVVKSLVEAGADLLELGVPFSDPLADGPTIQAATQKSLENGTTLRDCLAMTQELRRQGCETPAVIMGYINPMLAYGLEQFVADAAEAGVDGFIVPDLPPEEAAELEALCDQYKLALIYLLAPTSTPERIKLVAEKSKGFIYLVSLTGVTGARNELAPGLAPFVARVRKATTLPLAVGFGIGNGEQAHLVGQLADGVIVGSALVKRASESPQAVRALAEELRQALNN
ncbi:MAG: tryptophan synthase subunit alpha [Anaerolineaceae bacterium]|nr:tryptophan synthase subunit alpha [Anaerolineaceae bacterium]MCB9099427.1 tryptophan synthase subunit alpha [Anaerolineales bacterium]